MMILGFIFGILIYHIFTYSKESIIKKNIFKYVVITWNNQEHLSLDYVVHKGIKATTCIGTYDIATQVLTCNKDFELLIRECLNEKIKTVKYD